MRRWAPPNSPDFGDTILLIEDIREYLYTIDRMLYSLEMASIFDKISGLIVGGMTNIPDSNPPLGFTLEEIIKEKTWYRSFPAGHIDDNRALVFGEIARLEVGERMIFKQG